MAELITVSLVVPLIIVLLKIIWSSLNKKSNLILSKNHAEWNALPKASIVGLLIALRDLPTALEKVTKFIKQHGPVFRMSVFTEEIIVLNNPFIAQQVLASKELGHLPKPSVFYRSLHEMLGNGLITSKGHYWQEQRRLLSKGFTYSALKRYTTVYNRCAKRLVTDLGNLFDAKNGYEYQQINSMIHVCGIHIITETIMGLDILKDKTEAELVSDSFNNLKNIGMQRFRLGWLLFWNPIWKLHPLSWEHDKNMKKVDDVIKNLIARFESINILKQVKHPSQDGDEEEEIPFQNMMELMYKSGMNEDQILQEVKTLIWAGYETTGAAIQYLLFMLALNKNHQNECRKEVDRLFENTKYCPNDEFNIEGLSEMKHLERCFFETLRMFPVILSVTRKLDSTLKIDENLEIPAGVNVVMPIGLYHKDPEYFPNPEKFEPNRFLGQNNVKRRPLTFTPFSAGPRVCIGLKFAVMEVKTIVAHILREFEVHTCDKPEDIAVVPTMVSLPERDYYFYLKKRDIYKM